jgi:hypothetical protein
LLITVGLLLSFNHGERGFVARLAPVSLH